MQYIKFIYFMNGILHPCKKIQKIIVFWNKSLKTKWACLLISPQFWHTSKESANCVSINKWIFWMFYEVTTVWNNKLAIYTHSNLKWIKH